MKTGILWLSMAAVTAPAQSQTCEQWQVSGPFEIKQSNNLTVSGELTQDGSRLAGTARYYSPTLRTDVRGELTGFINGNAVRFRVTWFGLKMECHQVVVAWCDDEEYRETGIYEGLIDANGEIEGENWPFERPQARTNWLAISTARCGDAPSNPPPLPPPATPYQPGAADEARQTGPVGRDIQVEDTMRVDPPVSGSVMRRTQQLPPMAGSLDGANVIGNYDTTFGQMQLGAGGGRYDYNGGNVSIQNISGNVATGTWTETGTGNCPDGTRSGTFRFLFDESGFKGQYGNCGEEPSRPWNGKRL